MKIGIPVVNVRELVTRSIESRCKDESSYKYVLKGHDYRDGSVKIKQNYEKAAEHYQRAMKKGNAEAYFCMGQLHAVGQGIT